MFQLKPKTLNFWYKEILSNYHSDLEEKKFAAQSVAEFDVDTGEVVKENIIHILKPENVGDKMCIDEKMIGKRFLRY